jgi:hypothetical protein
MPIPIVVQSILHKEILTREAQIVGRRTGDGVDAAERIVVRLPYDGFIGVGHHDRPIEMVGVDEVQRRAGVDVGDQRDRHVVEPNVFGERVAGIVALGQQMAGLIVDVLRDPGQRHVWAGVDGKPIEAVVDVAARLRRPDRQCRQPAAIVIAIIVGGRAVAVGDQVAGAIVAEGTYRAPALRQRGELVVAAGIVVGVAVAWAQRFRGAVADAVISPVQRAPAMESRALGRHRRRPRTSSMVCSH